MPTYSLTLEYDGTDFAGWQIQPKGRTAMGVFKDVLTGVTAETPALTAAGRTDAGAHAHGQVVGCTLERTWKPEALRNALTRRFPPNRGACCCSPGFGFRCAPRRRRAHLPLRHRVSRRQGSCAAP